MGFPHAEHGLGEAKGQGARLGEDDQDPPLGRLSLGYALLRWLGAVVVAGRRRQSGGGFGACGAAIESGMIEVFAARVVVGVLGAEIGIVGRVKS